MKIIRKTILSLLLLSVLINGTFGFVPTANAQAELQPINVRETAQRKVECGMSVFGLCVPFTSLNSLAYFAAKVLIQQLTAEIVNWINTGFEGSPSFVTNPAGFFVDIADQEIGKMIENSADLNFLCTPFSLDIRLALAFKYRPFRNKISCTLSDVIGNSQNAIQGASINGFTKGDFAQGGWPAFASLTTEPQNNIYGAYIEAEDELTFRIANKQITKKLDLNFGRGFLSKEVCTETGSEDRSERADQGTGEGDYTGPERSFEGSGEGYVPERRCEVVTPGSFIENQLSHVAGSGIRQLELADSFNEIVNAALAQLVKMALNEGLRAASGSGPSDSSSYLNQLYTSQSLQNTQLNGIRENVLPTVRSAIARETEFRANKAATIDNLVATRTLIDNLRSCYNRRYSFFDLNTRLQELDRIMERDITPLVDPVTGDVSTANSNIAALQQIEQQIIRAQTANDTLTPTQRLADLSESTLHTQAELNESRVQRDQVTANMSRIRENLNLELQRCQLAN